MPIKLGRDAKVAIGWAVVIAGGIYGFVLSKRSVDQKRYENMKIRERMRNANVGEYEKERKSFQ